MADPVLHIVVGPNGAGKSTLWELVLEPVLHFEYVNADDIALRRWPKDAESRAYEAAQLAAARRRDLITSRASFATETVFSHESKVELVGTAVEAGYLVTLHVVVVPLDLAIARVNSRVEHGGHSVPEQKVRKRYERLWEHVTTAIAMADQVRVYDNTVASYPFRPIAEVERGEVLWSSWPDWAPATLAGLR